MPWLTGDETPDKVWLCFPVPVDTQFIANVLGSFNDMSKEFNWDAFGTATPKQSVEYANYALNNYMRLEDLGMLEDVRIVDGTLEKLFVGNPEWVPVGSVGTILSANATTLPAGSNATADVVGTVLELGIPRGDQGIQGEQGIQGIQGIQGVQGIQGATGAAGECDCNPMSTATLPQTTTLDQLCYAATTLAGQYSDSMQDVMESFDAGATTTAAALQLVGVIPIIGPSVKSAMDFVTEGLVQPVIDWARVNARDDQAITLAAEILYCRMLETKDSNPPFDNFFTASMFPVELGGAVVNLVNGKPTWDNFSDFIEFAFQLVTGEAMGYAIVAYAWAEHISAGILSLGGSTVEDAAEWVGLEVDTVDAQIGTLVNKAQYFDNRDCEAFECDEPQWCVGYDYTAALWGSSNSDNSTRGSWVMGTGWVSAQVNNPPALFTRVNCSQPLGSSTSVVRVEIDYNISGEDAENDHYCNLNLTGQGLVASVNLNSSQGVHTTVWTGSIDIDNLYCGLSINGSDQGQFVITAIRVYGTGDEPTQMGEACM